MKAMALSALSAALALPLAAGAQQPAPAPQPVIKVGEVATYTVQMPSERLTVEDTLTVTAIEGGLVKLKYQRTGPAAKEGEALYTDGWNLVQSAMTG